MNYIQSNFKGILKLHQKQKLSHFCKVDIELVIESHRKPLLCSTVFHKLPLLQQFPQTLFYYRKYFFRIIGNSFECDSTSRIVLGPSQNSDTFPSVWFFSPSSLTLHFVFTTPVLRNFLRCSDLVILLISEILAGFKVAPPFVWHSENSAVLEDGRVVNEIKWNQIKKNCCLWTEINLQWEIWTVLQIPNGIFVWQQSGRWSKSCKSLQCCHQVFDKLLHGKKLYLLRVLSLKLETMSTHAWQSLKN